MKFYKIFIFGLLILLFFESNSQNIYDNLGVLDTVEGVCKIRKIKKSKNKTGYIIYAEAEIKQGTARFIIVSLMADDKIRNKDIKKIKRNNHYYFQLFSYRPREEGVLHFDYLLDYQEVFIDGKNIIIDKTHSMDAIYTTPNLKGLYYLKP